MLRPLIATFLALASLSACQTSALQPAAVLKHVEVTGANIACIEQGSGIPVVFVHGSMSDRRIWEAQRPDLAPNYRYGAYDQRYFGTEPSRDDGRNLSQPTHAADPVAFIRSLQAGPVHGPTIGNLIVVLRGRAHARDLMAAQGQ
jgi:pimeloyl-ACP methyl ester carboxylesterase